MNIQKTPGRSVDPSAAEFLLEPAATSPSGTAKMPCAWVMSGNASTCCSFIAGCAPGHHRFENRKIHSRRCRADESLPNPAQEHWTLADENPPLGLISVPRRTEAVAQYAPETAQTVLSAITSCLARREGTAKEIAKTRKVFRAGTANQVIVHAVQ
jgi:hypothetical protein